MTFATIPQIAASDSLKGRIVGCVSIQIASGAYVTEEHPVNVIASRGLSLLCAAEPGWAEAWESALAGNVSDPGADLGVIPDAWILVATQKHLGITGHAS